MAIVDADYSTYIELLRGHLGKGTAPSAYHQTRLIDLIQDAVARLTTANAVNVTDSHTDDITAAVAAIDVEVGLLTPLDAATCTAGAGVAAAAVVATSVAALTAASAALVTAVAAIVTATPAEPTYQANTQADG